MTLIPIDFKASRADMIFMSDFGARLKKARKNIGLKAGELAMLAGINKDHLSRLENGRASNPGIETIEALANALGVPLSYFTEGDLPAKKESKPEQSSNVRILDSYEKRILSKLHIVKGNRERNALERIIDIFLKSFVKK